MTFMELQDDAPRLAQLRIVLLALLPKSGEPRTVAQLATSACTDKQSVSDALFDDYMDGRLGFDVVTDSFHNKRQGSAL